MTLPTISYFTAEKAIMHTITMLKSSSLLASSQLGGLLFKTFTCCTEGLAFKSKLNVVQMRSYVV